MRDFHFFPSTIVLAIGFAAAISLIATPRRSGAANLDRQIVAVLAEEDLPPANGSASGSANVAPLAQPAAEPDRDRTDDWQRVPEGGSDTRSANSPLVTGVPPDQVQPQGAAPIVPEPAPIPAIETPPPTPTRHAQTTPAPSPPIAAPPPLAPVATTPGVARATPAAQTSDTAMTGPPPALDVSTISASSDLGTIALDHEIRQAPSPARATSLRLTEQARKELAKGAMDSALRDLARAVSIDPGDPFEYYYLGRAYFLRKNYPQALTFFRRSQLGFGGRPEWLGETLSYEGACDEELGRPQDAAKAYQHALSVAPSNFRARIGYGRLSASLAPATSLDAPPPDAEAASAPPSADAAVPPPPQLAVPSTE